MFCNCKCHDNPDHATRCAKGCSNLLRNRYANAFVSADAQIAEQCSQTIGLLKGLWSHKKLSNQKPTANTNSAEQEAQFYDTCKVKLSILFRFFCLGRKNSKKSVKHFPSNTHTKANEWYFLPLQTVVFPDQVPFDWHERECDPDNWCPTLHDKVAWDPKYDPHVSELMIPCRGGWRSGHEIPIG